MRRSPTEESETRLIELQPCADIDDADSTHLESPQKNWLPIVQRNTISIESFLESVFSNPDQLEDQNLQTLLDQIDRQTLLSDLNRSRWQRIIAWLTLVSYLQKTLVFALANQTAMQTQIEETDETLMCKKHLWPANNVLPFYDGSTIRRVNAIHSFMQGLDLSIDHIWTAFFSFLQLNDIVAYLQYPEDRQDTTLWQVLTSNTKKNERMGKFF